MAGGEEVRLRATGSRADERTPAVLAGRTGWGGVPLGSARTVATPSQPPPAFAGEGHFIGPAPRRIAIVSGLPPPLIALARKSTPVSAPDLLPVERDELERKSVV